MYGSANVSYNMVRRWKMKFISGLEPIENTFKSGRLKSVSCDETVLKATENVESDARYTVRDIT